MTNTSQIIHTERLTLVPFAPAHADALFAMNSDPEVMRHLGPLKTLKGVNADIARVQERWKTYGYGWWSVFLKGTQTIVGAACLQNLAHEDGAPLEIGWRFMTAHQGHGYATEAGRAAMEFGFDTIGADYLVAVTSLENAASEKVMKRLGMRYLGIQTHYDEDCIVYEIHRP